ncbi:cardiolipin synthase [soil metagenome]
MSALHFVAGAVILAAELVVLVRAILRPNREPAARLAWVTIIIVAPIVGMVAYLLVGETRTRRRKIGKAIDAGLPRPAGSKAVDQALAASHHHAPFALARTVDQLGATQGNIATLAADTNCAIASMVGDIDAAKRTVHLCTYIWLDDHNGLKINDALVRAAGRGVAVRALADALGSGRFIRSRHWADLRASGVDARAALPVGNPVWAMLHGRVDLRNHRKSLIVDNRIAWCGSQNIADPEFRLKPRFAPWVDIATRWEGPVAKHCQFLFVSDWMGEGAGDISDCLREPDGEHHGEGIIAQVIGTGPTLPFDAMPACFAELIHSARSELVVTTPYFVPDEQLLYALLSAARRGVRTTLVFPKRNDSRFVAAASRSYYSDLIAAGARIFEFRPGLLHAKTMVVDGAVGLIGSANLDRRSFELNFENNILFADQALASQVRARQDEFVAQSDAVTAAYVAHVGLAARIWQNAAAMVSPLL